MSWCDIAGEALEEAAEKAAEEAGEPEGHQRRHSPDGCSPMSSHDGSVTEDTSVNKRPPEVPKLSLNGLEDDPSLVTMHLAFTWLYLLLIDLLSRYYSLQFFLAIEFWFLNVMLATIVGCSTVTLAVLHYYIKYRRKELFVCLRHAAWYSVNLKLSTPAVFWHTYWRRLVLLQLDSVGPATESESADVFEEEDIDNIVAEAKRAKKGSRLSSHLTVRTRKGGYKLMSIAWPHKQKYKQLL